MASKTLTAGVCSFSWISPKTGLPEVDKGGEPGERIDAAEIALGKKYRFSNFLEVVVDIDDRNGITRGAFTSRSGMYRGPSFLGLSSAPVGKVGRSMSLTRQSASFRQLVGCRTESPEKIGATVGAGVAGGAAVLAGVKLGALAGGWAGPVGMFVGAVALGAVGYFTGREVAELATAFPPIWTELELTVMADGSVKPALLSYSLFPSNTFYKIESPHALADPAKRYRQVGPSYDGDGVRLKRWKGDGWGLSSNVRDGPTAGNPWGMKDPGPELGSASVQREVPTGYPGS